MDMSFGRIAFVLIVVGTVGVARADEAAQLSAAERLERSKAHFDIARAHFNIGEYEAALHEFEEAYRYKPLPMFLYNIGQAASRAGHRDRAIEFFRRYLVLDPNTRARREVERRIEELEQSPAAPRAGAPPPLAPPPPAPASKPARVEPVAVVAPAPPPPLSRRWYADAVGDALAVAGVVALASGAVVVGQAVSQIAKEHESYANWVDARGAGDRQTVGAVVLGAGGALLAAGVVRYLVVAKRAHATLGATAGGRGASLTLSGAF